MNRATPDSWRPRLRRDLVHRTIEMRSEDVHVIHDPVAGNYFHFDRHEYRLIELADGTRTTSQIGDAYNDVFRDDPTRQVLPQAVREFFTKAAQEGLLVNHLQCVSPVSSSTPLQQSWLSVLAVKLPGFSPGRILPKLTPFVAWVTQPASVALLPLAGIVACLMIVLRWEDWSMDVARIANELSHPKSSNHAIVILLSIGIAKLIHEISHAVTSLRLGAEPREMGMMLLCGIPCLYVDITSSWLLPRATDRMRVAAAGILAEWWLAIMATGVWISTNPGIVHDCSAILVVVCSISTFLINGNPLLRYDGYYILSDWLGIVNLATKSRSAVDRFLHEGEHRNESLLIAYGLASSLYRILVLATLLWIAFRFLDDFGLAWLGMSILSVIAAKFIWKSGSSFQSPQRPVRLAAIVTVALILFNIPIPRWQTVPVEIHPAGATDLFVTHPGYLVGRIPYDQRIASDNSAIARLIQPRLEHQIAHQQTKQAVLQARISVTRVARVDNDDATVAIAELTKSLEQVKDQILRLEQQAERSMFHGEMGKVLFRVPEMETASVFNTDRDPAKGQYLPRGTRLGSLGDPHHRIAIARLDEAQAAGLRVGQTARIVLPENDDSTITGVIGDIRFESRRNEQRLSPGGEIDYRIRIEMDVPKSISLVVYRKARAKIHLPSRSLWQDLVRFFRLQFT